VHKTNDARQGLRVTLGKDAMPEIEYVPRSPTSPFQHVAYPCIDRCPRRKHERGIEIPLNGDVRSEMLPRNVQWQAPVDTDDGSPTGGNVCQQQGGPRAEVNRRRQRRDLSKDTLRVRQHHCLVAVGIEESQP
jgi:hypothetical protein